MANVRCWAKIAMVLNIIVAVFTMVLGINLVLYFFDNQNDVGAYTILSVFFMGICIFLLGLALLLVELHVKGHVVKRELHFLTHYKGRGIYVIFIALLSYTPDNMWSHYFGS